jgi:hypothetical protein
MATMAKPIRVFFSWQSDLPGKSTRYAILKSLEVFKKGHSESILIDEATRDEAGSPNIPQTILEKIGKADVFVADVSTINATDVTARKCPNPNVVFELGYAVQILGWSRIILLFNTEYGNLPDDLPFDFDRHRVSPFKLTEKVEKQAKAILDRLITVAVGGVISLDPKRPSELAGLTEEQLRHSRDVRALEWVLDEMHLPTIDDHLMSLPHSFPCKTLHFFEGVRGVVFGSLFYLNDKKLGAALRAFTLSWGATICRDDLYHRNQGSTLAIFTNPGDMPLPAEKETAWQEIDTARKEMSKNFTYILKRVHEDFPSIDLSETNRRAWQDYIQHNSST